MAPPLKPFQPLLEHFTPHPETSAPSLPSLPVTLAQIVSSTGSAISQWTSNGSAGRVSPFSNSSVSLTASSAIPQRMIDSNIGAPFSSHSPIFASPVLSSSEPAILPFIAFDRSVTASSHSAVFGFAPSISSGIPSIPSEQEETLSDDDFQFEEYFKAVVTAAEISNPEKGHSPSSVYKDYESRIKESGGRPYKSINLFLEDVKKYKKTTDENIDFLKRKKKHSSAPQDRANLKSKIDPSSNSNHNKQQLEEYLEILKTAAEISNPKKGHNLVSVYRKYRTRMVISGSQPYRSLSRFKYDVATYKQNRDKDNNFLMKIFKRKQRSSLSSFKSQAMPRDPKDEKELAKYLEALKTAAEISKSKHGHNIQSVYENYANQIRTLGGRTYKSLWCFREDVNLYKQNKNSDKNFLMKTFERKTAHSSAPQASLPAPSSDPAQEQETSAPLNRKRRKTPSSTTSSAPQASLPAPSSDPAQEQETSPPLNRKRRKTPPSTTSSAPQASPPAPSSDPAQEQETSAPLSRKRRKTPPSTTSSAPQASLPALSDPAQEQESNSRPQAAPWESHPMPAESRQNMLHPFDLDLDSPASGLPDTLQVDEPHPSDLDPESAEFNWNVSDNSTDISNFLN